MSEEQGNSKTSTQQEAENAVFDSGDFFDSLDNSVNGIVKEGENPNQPQQVTQSDSGSEQVTHNASQGSDSVDWDNENNPYKKRYKDSSREAVKMNDELRDLKPFVPVLEAMKRDSGLVDHVRNYLKSGGAPAQDIKQQLGLSEDFEYDAQEAVTDPDSDSAKLQNAHIDQVVKGRVGEIMNREKKNAQKMQAQFLFKKQAEEFKEKHNMSHEEFMNFTKQASSRKMTLDDAYYLINRDSSAKNIANNTKQDMLKQMKNVRNIPTSASDSNNQGNSDRNPSNEAFDRMMGLDDDVDNLFG
tara:strand:- start:1488 stop:2387 length:900 start_codon:yes stop_codon:yes gene_type:complete